MEATFSKGRAIPCHLLVLLCNICNKKANLFVCVCVCVFELAALVVKKLSASLDLSAIDGVLCLPWAGVLVQCFGIKLKRGNVVLASANALDPPTLLPTHLPTCLLPYPPARWPAGV